MTQHIYSARVAEHAFDRASLLRALLGNSIWILLGLCVLFFSFASPYFLTIGNLMNVIEQGAFVGFLAIGMTMVMINGQIDLSVGSVLTLSASLAVGLQPQLGIPGSIVVALCAGLAIGLFNGAVIVVSGINSFIVTLATLIGVKGLVFIYTAEQSLFAEAFEFSDIAMFKVGFISLPATLFLLLLCFFQWVLTRTKHGLEAYAIGDNRRAAVDAGIRVGRHIIINFAICGTLAALAGVLLSSRMGSATPNLGANYELWTIIAVVMGGTRLTGGFGNMWRTLGGVLALAVLRNGLNLMNIQSFYIPVILGLVLIVSLMIDRGSLMISQKREV